MKLLFLNHNIRGQGTFVRCYNLAVQLVKRGHRCTIICVASDSRSRFRRSEDRGVEILVTPSWGGGHYQGGGWGVLDILSRMGYLSLRRYDLVYAFDHRPSVAIPAFFQHYAGRVPLIADWADWWCRGGHISAARNFPLQYRVELGLEEGIKRMSDGVTAICSALRERALALGIPAERVLYLPSGADVEGIIPMDKAAMRGRHGIPRGIPIVGYISASLIDADMFLLAMARVINVRPDCKILFLGPDRGWHRDAAINMGIDDQFIWAGIRPYERIAEFLACADIMALPMRDNLINRGRWPNRIGEHMASGRATVCCAVGDMKMLFAEDGIGVLSRPDESDFAAQILALLDDPRKMERMGARAREIGETKYAWSIMAGRFRAFLETVPGTRGLHL